LLQTKHCTGSKRPGNINMESFGLQLCSNQTLFT
jgi:hypothetical protein